MKRWRLVVADRNTGAEEGIELDAESEVAALKRAGDEGYLVSAIKEIAPVIAYQSPGTQTGSSIAPSMVGTEKEKTFYADAAVLVTDKRIVVGSTSYAMGNLNFVASHRIPVSWRIVAYFGVPAAILLLFAAMQAGQHHGDNPSLWCFAIGTALLLVPIQQLFFSKRRFAVRIGTAGGESNILVDKDENRISQIVRAINSAFLER